MAAIDPVVIAPGAENPFIRRTYTRAAAGAQAIQIDDPVGPVAQLIPFDIRNGTLNDARSLLVKPTIPAIWYWRPIEGLQPRLAVEHVNAYIRTYRHVLSTHAGMDTATRRKVSIVLGVARATCTTLYNIEVDDLIPGEMGPAVLRAVTGAGGAIHFEPTADVPADGLEALGQPLGLSEEEIAAISSIHMCAIGLLPLQGYSLHMNDHHYLSDKESQSFKAFLALERQFWQANAVKAWWDTSLELLRDALFHKVGHPVLINLKMELAMRPDMAEKLKTAGCGSAAARLPAVESEMRTAGSYRTLCQSVRSYFESYGGYLNYCVLEDAMDAVNLCPHGSENPITEANRPGTVADSVVDRKTALAYLKTVLTGHVDIVATCYGFYVTMAEARQTSTGAMVADTLKTSHSLKKVHTAASAAYNRGAEMFGDYSAYMRKLRADGKYSPPGMLFTGAKPFPPGMMPSNVGTSSSGPGLNIVPPNN